MHFEARKARERKAPFNYQLQTRSVFWAAKRNFDKCQPCKPPPHPHVLASGHRLSLARFHLAASFAVTCFNPLHVAGVSRRQVKNLTKCLKNINIFEIGDYI